MSELHRITRIRGSPNAGTALPAGEPAGYATSGPPTMVIRSDRVSGSGYMSLFRCGEHDGQVAITPIIHAAVASKTVVSSRSIETPTARSAAFVDGQAICAPTRWSSDA